MEYSCFEEIKELLDQRTDLYNRPEFVVTDPVQVPHMFSKKEDIEIAGFLAATLSWGQRKTIINNSKRLLSLMDNQPWKFLRTASESDFRRFENFCHRTFNATDTLYFLHSLRIIYKEHGGLQKVFEEGFNNSDNAGNALMHFRKVFFEAGFPQRTLKHVSDISKGSSGKRLNMFLRWMVRRDDRGVDFGIWRRIDPAWLMIPLDLHSGRTARSMGLLSRKQDDWKAVSELTENLRQFDPRDPVKYDFALFGISVFEQK